MLLSSTKSDLSTAIESDDGGDHESQPAGPSATRLSHFSRNYRRRVIDESSSDDEQSASNSFLETSSIQRPAEGLEVEYSFYC